MSICPWYKFCFCFCFEFLTLFFILLWRVTIETMSKIDTSPIAVGQYQLLYLKQHQARSNFSKCNNTSIQILNSIDRKFTMIDLTDIEHRLKL